MDFSMMPLPEKIFFGCLVATAICNLPALFIGFRRGQRLPPISRGAFWYRMLPLKACLVAVFLVTAWLQFVWRGWLYAPLALLLLPVIVEELICLTMRRRHDIDGRPPANLWDPGSQSRLQRFFVPGLDLYWKPGRPQSPVDPKIL